MINEIRDDIYCAPKFYAKCTRSRLKDLKV